MPIEIEPIETTKAVVEPVTLSQLWVDSVIIDGTARETSPPRVAIRVTPFNSGNPSTFAAESWEMTTANVYAAAARIPAVGQAIGAIFAAIGAWHEYEVAREADIVTATAARDAASATVTQAQFDIDAAEQARNDAFVARASVADPIWTEADAAWQSAVVALQEAEQALSIASARLAQAHAALADPANDPIT